MNKCDNFNKVRKLGNADRHGTKDKPNIMKYNFVSKIAFTYEDLNDINKYNSFKENISKQEWLDSFLAVVDQASSSMANMLPCDVATKGLCANIELENQQFRHECGCIDTVVDNYMLDKYSNAKTFAEKHGLVLPYHVECYFRVREPDFWEEVLRQMQGK